jgi:hypothetical protein
MSDLRSDMSDLVCICSARGGGGYVRSPETLYNKKVAKMMRLGSDELTISKLDNMELREITGTTKSNINFRIQI